MCNRTIGMRVAYQNVDIVSYQGIFNQQLTAGNYATITMQLHCLLVLPLTAVVVVCRQTAPARECPLGVARLAVCLLTPLPLFHFHYIY